MADHGLALLLGAPKDDDDDEDMHGGHDDEMSHEEHAKAKLDAAEEAFEALKSNDKARFARAMTAHHELCMNGPEDEPSKDDMKDDDEDEDDDDGLKV